MNRGLRRRGASAASRLGAALLLLAVAAVPGCRKPSQSRPANAFAPGPLRGDALFLSEAPAFVPDESERELDAMGIGRVFVNAASLGKDGRATPASPPPIPFRRPIVLVLMGGEDAASGLTGRGAAVGAEWGRAARSLMTSARTWGPISGIHVHLWPAPEQAKDLAAALGELKKALGGAPVSVTLPSSGEPTAWKPLAGVADEALVFFFGRRPELGGRIVGEMQEESARAFPIPFHLLVAFGSYGQTGDGQTFAGRLLPDGRIDDLSQDRALDFEFGQQVFSAEPGTIYTFKPRPGARSPLAAEGGYARFQIPTIAEGLRSLANAARWAAPNLLGRVFLVGGVPKDGHLIGYAAVRALLTGKPLEPRLNLEVTQSESGHGWADVVVTATNTGPTPTALSHYDSYVQLRAEGGTFVSVKAGEFDRYEQLTSEAEGFKPTGSARAVVCRLFDNLFAPGEVVASGPIRISGARPQLYASWHLTQSDSQANNGVELEVPIVTTVPRGAPSRPPRPAKRR